MTDHTPGPWRFVESPAWGYSTLWNPETREEVLVTEGQNDGDSPETWMGEELTDANRALIEAAPDLLAACKDLLDAYFDYHDSHSLTQSVTAKSGAASDAAIAAIAKAKGETP